MFGCFSSYEGGSGERKAFNTQLLPAPPALAATEISKGEWPGAPTSVNQVSSRADAKVGGRREGLQSGRQCLAFARCRGGKWLLKETEKTSKSWVSSYLFSSGNRAQKRADEEVRAHSYFRAIRQFFLYSTKRSLKLPAADVTCQLVCRRNQFSQSPLVSDRFTVVTAFR